MGTCLYLDIQWYVCIYVCSVNKCVLSMYVCMYVCMYVIWWISSENLVWSWGHIGLKLGKQKRSKYRQNKMD